ncbi:MAG: metallophosphoesterase family protein [Polyangiaceae bacterium]|nr:metallophosphoesterase family protein [Polyangiaceae bacterium]
MFASGLTIDKYFLDFRLPLVGRSIFIGDVHGCGAELDTLLDRLAPTVADRIWFVGDLVARGPDSHRVVATARAIGARAVRGNHEERLVIVRRARAQGERGPRLSPGHEQVYASLDTEDWAWLEALPLWIDVPEHEVRVVHAGVVPGLPIFAQDREHLLHLRTILEDGTPSSRLRGRLWGESYHGPPHLVFGHNAITGLQLHPHATGLDSGCVYGGTLSAVVLPLGATLPAEVEDRRGLLVSVPARRAYVHVPSG